MNDFDKTFAVAFNDSFLKIKIELCKEIILFLTLSLQYIIIFYHFLNDIFHF